MLLTTGVSLLAQMVKNLPAMQDTQAQSLVWEDPLEKEMATHSSMLAYRIPWTEEPGGLQSTGSQMLDMTEWLPHTIYLLIFVFLFQSQANYSLTSGSSEMLLHNNKVCQNQGEAEDPAF